MSVPEIKDPRTLAWCADLKEELDWETKAEYELHGPRDVGEPPPDEAPPLGAIPVEPKTKEYTPVNLAAFTVEEILADIEPELMLLPGIPAEAYTVVAGSLSAFKTTFLLYLLIWKATGWDVLGLDERSGGCDIGKSLLLTYEDTNKRVFAKLQRVIQHGYRVIASRFGQLDADTFAEHAAQNLRRVALAGDSSRGLVQRIPGGTIVPNELFIAEIVKAVRTFAPDGALIGIDPLRLAVVGSQNDDDGADVVVHVLNRLAAAIQNSGLIVCSHSNKAISQEPENNKMAAAYGTSGSALYSQHARSNFLLARLKSQEIRDTFSAETVTEQDTARQSVVRLTHGRLSHGPEQADVYLLQREGTLTRIAPKGAQTATDVLQTHGVAVLRAIQRMKGDNVKASGSALEQDTALVKALGSREALRKTLMLLEENRHVEADRKTKGRQFSLTESGQRLAGSGEIPRDPAGAE